MDNIVLHTPSMNKALKAYYEDKITGGEIDALWDLLYEGIRLSLVGVPDLENNELRVGLSICSYPDNFNKKLGVELATKRANDNPSFIIDMLNSECASSYKCCLQELQECHAQVASNVNAYKRLIGARK